MGDIFGIALRLFSHRNEIERLWPRIVDAESKIRDVVQVASDAKELVTRIAPELVAQYRPTAEPSYDVQWLQQSLNTLTRAGLEVDGVLGPVTKRAIENFQRQQGLAVDGWAGIATEARILELLTNE